MILTIYLFLLALSLILIGLGFFIDVPVLQIAGFGFLFVTGTIMLGGNVEYRTGTNITNNNNTYVITPVYTNFSDSDSHWFGLYLTAVSILGFATAMVLKNRGGLKS